MLILAVFLLAGFVKGVIGLGLPTIAMGLLTLAMPPPAAAALLILPSVVTNLFQMRPATAALASPGGARDSSVGGIGCTWMVTSMRSSSGPLMRDR